MSGGGGGGGMFGANSPLFAKAVQQNTPSNAGVAYTTMQQGPRYTPQYQQFQQTSSPTLQNALGPKYTQQQGNGIQSLYNMFSSPMQQNRGLSQLNPMPPYVGSTYRPSMAQLNLNRVASPVIPQQPYTEGQTPEYVATPPMSTENGQS